MLQPVAQLLERRPARVGRRLLVLVRLDVQILAADGAEPLAVGRVEDLVGKRERDRVARPGRQLDLVVDDVLAAQLGASGRVGVVVLARVDTHVDHRVLEAAHARPVQSDGEAQPEHEPARRLRDRQLGRRRLRHGQVALAAQVEGLELDGDGLAVLLPGAKPYPMQWIPGHESSVATVKPL
jgi:hypothetical protein